MFREISNLCVFTIAFPSKLQHLGPQCGHPLLHHLFIDNFHPRPGSNVWKSIWFMAIVLIFLHISFVFHVCRCMNVAFVINLIHYIYFDILIFLGTRCRPKFDQIWPNFEPKLTFLIFIQNNRIHFQPQIRSNLAQFSLHLTLDVDGLGKWDAQLNVLLPFVWFNLRMTHAYTRTETQKRTQYTRSG